MKVKPMRYVSLSLLLLSLSGCSLAPVGNRWCSELAAYSLSQREALPEQGAPVRTGLATTARRPTACHHG